MSPSRKNEDGDAFPPGVGKPATRALEGAGYTRLTQLTQVTEAELLQLHGMGPKAMGVLREALKAAGRSFAKSDPKASSTKTAKRSAPAPEDVETFLASLEHPFKQEILALRQIILGADPSIAEGIKWNAPSFRTSEYFATLHLRAKDGVQVILHLGAKARDSSAAGVAIADPESLLEWLARDRASAKFRDLKDINARRAAFANVIRQWIKHVH